MVSLTCSNQKELQMVKSEHGSISLCRQGKRALMIPCPDPNVAQVID